MTETLQETGDEIPSIPAFLRSLRSVLLAVVERSGALVDANRGFRRLLPHGPGSVSPTQVRAVFLDPSFDTLVSRAHEGEGPTVHSGPMTLGEVDGESDDWHGSVLQRGDHLLVICERDIDQDRQVQRRLLQLTEEHAQKEKELTRAQRQLARYAEEVERLSLTDSLTGLANRRHFDALMAHELAAATRGSFPLALLLLDLDRFEAVNESHGNEQGDVLLQAVAATLSGNVRASDVVARWDGEEFAILATRTNADGAAEVAERLRRAVQDLQPPDDLPGVTVTVAVSELRPGETGEELVQRADRALRQAKQGGPNRVLLAGGDR